MRMKEWVKGGWGEGGKVRLGEWENGRMGEGERDLELAFRIGFNKQ